MSTVKLRIEQIPPAAFLSRMPLEGMPVNREERAFVCFVIIVTTTLLSTALAVALWSVDL